MTIPMGGFPSGPPTSGHNYPLVNPSADIQGMLADAYLELDDRNLQFPFSLYRIRGICQAQSSCIGTSVSSSGDSNPADVLVLDGEGVTAFDTRHASFRQTHWSARFDIYEWKDDRRYLKLLLHRGWNDLADERGYQEEFTPASAVLDPRTVLILPKRVRSLKVNDVELRGKVELISGYNAATTIPKFQSNRTKRHKARASLSLAPGGGIGRYPDCADPNPKIRRIAGVSPDPEGRFYFQGKGCIVVSQPNSLIQTQPRQVQFTPATLQIGSDCLPCCDCDDFAFTYKGMKRLHDAYKTIGAQLEATRDLFAINRERWLNSKTCRSDHRVVIRALPMPGGLVDVKMGYCNADPDCKYDLEMHISLETSTGLIGHLQGPTLWLTDARGRLRAVNFNQEPTWPVLIATFGKAQPQTAYWMMGRWEIPGATSDVTLTLQAQPYISGVGRPGAETSVQLQS